MFEGMFEMFVELEENKFSGKEHIKIYVLNFSFFLNVKQNVI